MYTFGEWKLWNIWLESFLCCVLKEISLAFAHIYFFCIKDCDLDFWFIGDSGQTLLSMTMKFLYMELLFDALQGRFFEDGAWFWGINSLYWFSAGFFILEVSPNLICLNVLWVY